LETNVHTFRQVTCVLATQIFVRSIGGQYIQCFTIEENSAKTHRVAIYCTKLHAPNWQPTLT
jgi:hypothetical protein